MQESLTRKGLFITTYAWRAEGKGEMQGKDITEKTLEAYNDVFADIINVFMFNGRQVIKEKELTDARARSYYKADGRIREQERDVAKYWRRSKFKIAMLGIENQTAQDKSMPLRVIGYDGAAYRNQIKAKSPKGKKGKHRRRKKGHYYPVITIVLSFDYEKRWTTPVNLVDCLGKIPEELKPYVSDYRINVFEVAFLSREQVELFQSDFKVVADYFVQMRENNDYIPSKETLEHVREVFDLMSVVAGDARFEEAYSEERSDTNMCEFLDRVEARGEARGVAIGEARGEARGKALGEACGIIKGTVATCREFNMTEDQILSKICVQFSLDAKEAAGYL